ncbi:M23 family metallopeptidase [Phytohabitans sp. LJ34]|uniref:M23 family metallopeptidase n=1 Tax=Phytohabitans sp. LJ34 TaxID=3452217 RepID=UPI003F8A4241
MSSRAIATIVAAGLCVVLVCGAGTAVLTAGTASACTTTAVPTATHTTGAGAATTSGPSTQWSPIEPFNSEQVGNAVTIIRVGADTGLPSQAWVIAVATAITESSLYNRTVPVDHDSLGLFQQRPSQGWGTPQQLTDPVYASQAFYRKLATVDGWQTMPLAEAAQAVQKSARPNAYQKWAEHAAMLVTTISETLGLASCAASGWTQPVQAPVTSGFRTAERPTHDGVDLGAPRGTIVRAAAAGKVVRVRCNAIDIRDDSDWGCHRDGDKNLTRGCGWYIDLAHDGGIITRYCHLGRQPTVHVGDTVSVGAPIGVVGSTGHSSGPHLHFEVHVNADSTSDGVVPPEPFMAQHGAPLGQAG